MPTPTIPAGNLFMNATLYTGTSAAQSITNGVAGQSFQPDMVWCKSRSGAYDHGINDVVRGAGNTVIPNTTNAEQAWSAYFTAFNSNGFSVASNGGTFNLSGTTYVGWQWKAGGTAVSNTSGTITSSVSANTTAGFSVVTYTGNGVAGATIGHGLGATPSMIIHKCRNAATDWPVYHSSIGNTAAVFLDLTNAAVTDQAYWNNTSPTSSVFTVCGPAATGSDTMNKSGNTYVNYCWAPIAGYSAFGSYTGNGSADGPFVYTGFQPRWLMIKVTNTTDNWYVIDTARQTYNVFGSELIPNSSSAEVSFTLGDIVSNGFKIRNSGSVMNGNGNTVIYAAFASNPFKYANAF